MKIRLACAALAVLLGAGLALLHGAAGELASVRADKRVGFQKYTVARDVPVWTDYFRLSALLEIPCEVTAVHFVHQNVPKRRPGTSELIMRWTLANMAPMLVAVGTRCGNLMLFTPEGMLVGEATVALGADAQPGKPAPITALAQHASIRSVELIIGLQSGRVAVYALDLAVPDLAMYGGTPAHALPPSLVSASLTFLRELSAPVSKERPPADAPAPSASPVAALVAAPISNSSLRYRIFAAFRNGTVAAWVAAGRDAFGRDTSAGMHRAHPSWTSLTGPMLPFENTMVGVTSEGVSVLDIRSLRTAVLPCLRNHPAGSPVVSAFDPLNPHRAYVLMDSGSVLSLHMAGTKAFKACSVVQTTPAVGAGAGGAVAALRNYLLVGGDGDAGGGVVQAFNVTDTSLGQARRMVSAPTHSLIPGDAESRPLWVTGSAADGPTQTAALVLRGEDGRGSTLALFACMAPAHRPPRAVEGGSTFLGALLGGGGVGLGVAHPFILIGIMVAVYMWMNNRGAFGGASTEPSGIGVEDFARMMQSMGAGGGRRGGAGQQRGGTTSGGPSGRVRPGPPPVGRSSASGRDEGSSGAAETLPFHDHAYMGRMDVPGGGLGVPEVERMPQAYEDEVLPGTRGGFETFDETVEGDEPWAGQEEDWDARLSDLRAMSAAMGLAQDAALAGVAREEGGEYPEEDVVELRDWVTGGEGPVRWRGLAGAGRHEVEVEDEDEENDDSLEDGEIDGWEGKKDT